MGDLMDMPGAVEAPPTIPELIALAKANKARATLHGPACPHCGVPGQHPTISTLGERMKELRLRAGLTQQRLADLCGVTKSAVSQWEAGVTDNIGLQAFLKMLSALHTDFEYLAFGKAAPASAAVQNQRLKRR